MLQLKSDLIKNNNKGIHFSLRDRDTLPTEYAFKCGETILAVFLNLKER